MSERPIQDAQRTRRGQIRTRRRWAIHPRVQEKLEELVDTHPGWAKMQLVLKLEDEPELNGLLPKSDKTLLRAIDDLVVYDDSGVWSPQQQSSADEIADLLDMKAALHEWTDWTVRTLTFDEAKWLTRYRQSTEGLDHRTRWRLTMQLRRRFARGAPTDELELYLGYKPWRSANDAERYRQALQNDPELEPPAWLYGDLEGMTYEEVERMLNDE